MPMCLEPQPKSGLEPKSHLFDCPGLFLDVLREGSNLEPSVLDFTEAGMERDKVVWSGPGRQEARGCGLGTATSESCAAEPDKGKPDEKEGLLPWASCEPVR